MMNKKGAYGIRLFSFFFGLMIITAILFFFLTAFPVILYDYGLNTVLDINQGLVDDGVSSASSQVSATAVAEGYKSLYTIADYAFLLFIISVFVGSVVSAYQAKREGIFSFFGLMTLGSILLIFILSFAVEIQNWIINEVVYGVLLISFEVPIAMWFFDYNIYIGIIWYVILLLVNIIDFKGIGSKFGFVGEDEQEMRFDE